MVKKITTYSEENDKTYIPIALLKFGKLHHLQDLLNNGILYVSSIQEIRKLKEGESDKDNFRNDPAEGATSHLNTGPAKAQFQNLKSPSGEPLSIDLVNVSFYNKPEFVLGNICSFYGITNENFINNELIAIDPAMKYFGSHFLFIKNFDEFIRRIDVAIEKSIKSTWYYGYVNYFNEDTYSGKLNLFKKRSRYSFQKEFRLYFATKNKTYIKIKLGNISDIATIISSDVLEHLSMTLNLEDKCCDVKFLVPTNK